MKQNELIYTISEDYYIIIRIRKCYNTFMLKLMNKNNERIEEICCTQDKYNESIETLINISKLI